MDFLDKIRVPKKSNDIKRQVIVTLGILLFGISMGLFSKFLDYRQGELPALLQVIDNTLDFHNFLGGFAPWIVIAVCISNKQNTSAKIHRSFFKVLVIPVRISSNR